MQSADNSTDCDSEWWLVQKQTVRDFSGVIERCLTESDWDGLAATLDSRQAFLQQLFSDSIPQIHQQLLRGIAESILVEDAVFQTRLESEKHAIAQQHEINERSRRALKAYGDQ